MVGPGAKENEAQVKNYVPFLKCPGFISQHPKKFEIKERNLLVIRIPNKLIIALLKMKLTRTHKSHGSCCSFRNDKLKKEECHMGQWRGPAFN